MAFHSEKDITVMEKTLESSETCNDNKRLQ